MMKRFVLGGIVGIICASIGWAGAFLLWFQHQVFLGDRQVTVVSERDVDGVRDRAIVLNGRGDNIAYSRNTDGKVVGVRESIGPVICSLSRGETAKDSDHQPVKMIYNVSRDGHMWAFIDNNLDGIWDETYYDGKKDSPASSESEGFQTHNKQKADQPPPEVIPK